MAKDLNVLYRIDIISPCKFRKIDIVKLKTNPIKSQNDWTEQHFTSLKRNFRYVNYKTQNRRCAYCRRLLNPLGINEHIDHIVARKHNYKWMFKPKNLVLTCFQCNTQKSVHIATRDKNCRRLPKRPRHYILFNPYVHKWFDHFEIEDEIFIKAKTPLGHKTIRDLKLYDFKYSIVYANESNTFGASAIKRATNRLYSFPKSSVEYKSAEKLIKEIERHIL